MAGHDLLCIVEILLGHDDVCNCIPAERAHEHRPKRVLTPWYPMLQGELDSIRSELASLRQSIGRNRSADHISNSTNRSSEALPGTNMV